jgi:hypothetical protein
MLMVQGSLKFREYTSRGYSETMQKEIKSSKAKVAEIGHIRHLRK